MNLLKGWGLGTLLLLASFLGTSLLGGLEFVKVDFSQRIFIYLLSLIPFWFIQGGTEELVTRGWLLQTVTSKLNLSWGIAISSSLFSILHLGNQGVTALSLISIVLVGVLLALYMLKTDNIWGVAALHGAWNFTQGNLVGVAVSGQNAGDSLLRFHTKSGVPGLVIRWSLWSRREYRYLSRSLGRDYYPSSTIEKRKLLRLSSKTRSFYFCVKIEESLEKGKR